MHPQVLGSQHNGVAKMTHTILIVETKYRDSGPVYRCVLHTGNVSGQECITGDDLGWLQSPLVDGARLLRERGMVGKITTRWQGKPYDNFNPVEIGVVIRRYRGRVA